MDCGVILVLTLQIVLANSQNYTGCDYYQLLEFGSIYRISSPGRGSSAPRYDKFFLDHSALVLEAEPLNLSIKP